MNRALIVMAAGLVACAGAYAQDAPTNDGGPKVLMYQTNTAGPIGPVTAGGMFFSADAGPGGGKAITGAPYTASASTETTQILGDGNRIVNNYTTSVARDSQGRTRREETMGMVGPWQVNGPKLVFINDPASQTNYVLDENKQTAMVMKMPSNLPQMPTLPPPGVQAVGDAGFTAQGGASVTFISERAWGRSTDACGEDRVARRGDDGRGFGRRQTSHNNDTRRADRQCSAD